MIDYQVFELNSKLNIVYFPKTLDIGVLEKNQDIENQFYSILKRDITNFNQKEKYIKKIDA